MRRLLPLLALLFLLPARADEVTLKHAGLTLNANLEKTASWPAGPVVLVVHGTLAHNGMELIAGLQPLLAAKGLSSLAINLGLGVGNRHGMYDCATPHRHRHVDAVAEIGAWIDWLKQQGTKQVVLLGHSRGGNQAAWFAAERDDPALRAVVLAAPATWTAAEAAQGYEKRYGKPLAPTLEKAKALVAAGKGDTLMEQVDFVYCANTSATAAAFVGYYAPDERFDTPTLLPRINEPALVVAAGGDELVKDLPARAAPVADGKKVRLVTIDGADHFFRDLYAEDMVEAIAKFVASEVKP